VESTPYRHTTTTTIAARINNPITFRECAGIVAADSGKNASVRVYPAKMLRDVVAIVDDVIHPFELGVACEVFGIDRSDEGLPVFDFAVCAANRKPLPGTGGMSVRAGYGLDRAATADLIVIPAWHRRDERPPTAIVRALHDAVDRGATVLSECTGVFLLAEAGLLDGRCATAHWRDADLLANRFPGVAVQPDRLYVEDGPVITSAGTAAGIDACLYVVRRELGAAVAVGIARRMIVPPQRDGGQSQYVETPMPKHTDDHLAPLLAWMQGHLHTSMTIADLAARAHMSERTFARRFTAVTGTTPNSWLTRQRIVLAQRLLEERDLDIEQVARHCGFRTADLLRHHFVHQVGTTPTAYRRTFSRA
jgi:AraC family transcriptional regulator, transcriptional activator FtrA